MPMVAAVAVVVVVAAVAVVVAVAAVVAVAVAVARRPNRRPCRPRVVAGPGSRPA